MPEVRVSRVQRQRGALKVNVDSVKAVLRFDLRYRVHEIGNACLLVEREILTATAERDQHLLPLALQPRNIVFHLREVQPRPHVHLHRALRRLMIHVCERNDDHIPLRRNISQAQDRSSGSASRPVPDQFVPVLCCCRRNGRDS